MRLKSPRVVAIANQKGGVGKTTTALSLGAALGALSRRVLVADLDPHGSASAHLGFFPENITTDVRELMLAEEPDRELCRKVIKSAPGAGFDFMPGSPRLSELDADLRNREGKGVILSKLTELFAPDYDYVILDCPPHMGVLLANALVACDILLIPVQTDFLALHGLRLIFDSVRTFNRILPRPIEYRILATMYDRRAGACRRVVELLRGKLGPRMFETVIGLDTKLREASALGKVIYEIAPQSRAAREYVALARELETLVSPDGAEAAHE